jgi:hypothetical protein
MRFRCANRISVDHGFDIGHSPTLTAWTGEVGAVVRQNGVDLVRDCLDQVPQEVGCDTPRGFLVQLGEGELRGSIDSDEEIKPSHRSANLGDVDVEVSDRIILEFAPYTLAILHVGNAKDPPIFNHLSALFPKACPVVFYLIVLC